MVKPSAEDYLLPLVQYQEEFHRKNFLILEGREHSSEHGSYSYSDSYVAKSLSHHGKNWYDSQAALHAEGFEMLTPRQFVDFLNLLKSKKAFDGRGNKVSSSELDTIFEEIIEPGNTLRVEWLDAAFDNVNEVLHIAYAHQTVNGKLQPQRRELLQGCLRVENQLSHISLEDYLERATFQGLPPVDVKSGSLNYTSPCSYRVAEFEANSYAVGNGLFCNGGKLTLNSSGGVRRRGAKN